MKKRYGDTDTHLTLTDKAQRAYDSISPVDIYEITSWDDDIPVYTYSVNICGEVRKSLKDWEVNELLEEYAEPITVRQEMRENGGRDEQCACYSTADGKKFLIDMPGNVDVYDADSDVWDGGAAFDLTDFAKSVNPDYAEYYGWDNLHIAKEVMERRDCRDCPAFEFCEAMDKEVQDDC